MFNELEVYGGVLETIILLSLIISYLFVKSLIKKYHIKRYNEIKRSLTFFVIAETVPIFAFVLYKVITLNNT